MKNLILLIFLCPSIAIGQFSNYSLLDGLIGDNVKCFKEDINGNIWIGTTNGLSFNDGVNFTNYNTNDGLISNSVKAIEISNTNKIWIGTNSGISVFDGFTFANYTTNEGLIGNNVYDIQKDAIGNIWIATTVGISVYNGFTFVNYTTVEGLPTNSIRQVEMDNNGTIWIGTTAGLCRFDNPGFTTYTTANGMPSNFIDVLEAKDIVYMKGGGPRICVFDGTTFTTFDNNNGLPSLGILNGITVDNDTNIWLSYSDKIIKFKLPNVNYYSASNTNLINGYNNIYTQLNKIYIASSNGYFVSPYNNIIANNNSDTLMINNIKALVNSDGILFQHPTTYATSTLFEVPLGSGLMSNFSSSLWIGGMDQNNIYHVAAGKLHNINDWGTGPISNNYNTYQYDSVYNRDWKINKTDIDFHILHWNDSGYVVPHSIREWPEIAEYFDFNSNNIYDPDSGDYPLVMGDQAILSIFNDDIKVATPGRNKIQAEVHALVYGYDAPNDSALNNTIFVQYKVKNKSINDYNNVYIGIFDDFDIGDYSDDYIGVDTNTNSFYAYNGDSYDFEYGYHIPAQGIAFLSSKMTSATYFNFTFGPTGNPATPLEYFNILMGKWRDGTPYTDGGIGYGGTTPVNYVFTGNPESPTEWNEAFIGNPPGDRQGIGVVGPFNLGASQEICLDIAHVNAIAYDGDNILSVKYLIARMDQIQWWKSQNPGLSCDSIVSIPSNNLSIYAQDYEYCSYFGNISLDCTYLNGVYPFTFQWTDSIGTVISTDEIPIIPIPTSSTIFNVTITDALGSTATDTLSVTIHPLPSVSLGTFPIQCPGDTVTIDIPGYSEYEWSNGNTTGSVNLILPGEYYVFVTDSNGCQTADTTQLQYYPNTLNINDITPSCVGGIATIDAGSGFSTYLWNTGDTTQYLLVNTPFSGQATYSVTVTTNGCEFSDSTIVDVTAPFTNLGNDTSIFSNETLNLNPGNYFDYLWSDASTNPINVFDGGIGSGIYTVWVQTTDYYGCVSSDTIQITVTLWIGIDDIYQTNVQIFPNPTTGKITVKAEGIENIEVLNLQGKEIYNGIENEIDLNPYSKGIYIIKVTTNNGVAVGKVILN